MIYTDSQLKEKIVRMIESFENEVVEFKEARTNYSFNDIGKYFSALSNEANLRGLQEAWLIFGISDDKRYVGTEFRKQGSLQSLKKEIVNGTNERLTFLEIYELTMEKCRVIAFQIPPAISKGHLSLCQKYCRPSAECPQTESIRNRDTVFDGQHDQHGKQ